MKTKPTDYIWTMFDENLHWLKNTIEIEQLEAVDYDEAHARVSHIDGIIFCIQEDMLALYFLGIPYKAMLSHIDKIVPECSCRERLVLHETELKDIEETTERI